MIALAKIVVVGAIGAVVRGRLLVLFVLTRYECNLEDLRLATAESGVRGAGGVLTVSSVGGFEVRRCDGSKRLRIVDLDEVVMKDEGPQMHWIARIFAVINTRLVVEDVSHVVEGEVSAIPFELTGIRREQHTCE